jgi:hypothetical protein
MIRATIVEHPFDPNMIKPGVYVTDSMAPAYPAARFLVESGRANALERYLPGGHIELTFEVLAAGNQNAASRRNPAEEAFERKGTIKLTRKWLEARTREYSNWRTAWWREAIQNSIDPGTGAASRVELVCKEGPDGNWIVSCADNGNGMTRDQVEDEEKGFLVFGGSGKGSGSSIGGFGEAKQLLIFPWLQYRLLTADQEYVGRGGDWSARNAPMRRGVLLEVIMPPDMHTTPEDCMHVLKRSWIPRVTFLLNGKVVATGSPTPSEALDEVPDQGIVYSFSKKRGETPEVMVRAHGLWMFSETLIGSAKHGLIVEVTGKSTDMFTTNRDGFSWNADKLRRKISAAKEEMTSEGKVRKKAAPVERVFRGTGKFGIEAKKEQAPVRAMQVREAAGELPRITSGSDGAKMTTEQITAVAKVLESFTEQDVQDFVHADISDATEAGAGSSYGLDVLMQIASASPGAASVIMQALTFKGQKGMDAAVKQMVWKPDFYLLKDAGYEFTIPKKFTPEDMTPAVLRLVKTWAEICRFILASWGEGTAYGVGFWFSEDASAGYLYRRKEHWLLLDPHKSKTDRKEIYNPTNQEDLATLWAMALHEVAHMLVRIKNSWEGDGDADEAPQPASHGSELANQQTWLQAKLAAGWMTVRKIASSIKLRGQIPGSKPAKPPREPSRVQLEWLPPTPKSKQQDYTWIAEDSFNYLNKFVTKFKAMMNEAGGIEPGPSSQKSLLLPLALFLHDLVGGTSVGSASEYDSLESFAPVIEDLITKQTTEGEHKGYWNGVLMTLQVQSDGETYDVTFSFSDKVFNDDEVTMLHDRVTAIESMYTNWMAGDNFSDIGGVYQQHGWRDYRLMGIMHQGRASKNPSCGCANRRSR